MFYIWHTHHFISRVCSVSHFHRGDSWIDAMARGFANPRNRDAENNFQPMLCNALCTHTSYFFGWNGWLISFVCSHGCSEIALERIVCFLEIPHKKWLLCFQFVRFLFFFGLLRKSSEKNYVRYATHAVISMCTMAKRVRSKSNFQISRMAWAQAEKKRKRRRNQNIFLSLIRLPFARIISLFHTKLPFKRDQH